MFFDDSYEHGVVHEGESMRVVLLIRFWHPDLPVDRRMPTLEEGLSRFEEMQRRRMIPPQNPTVRELVRAAMPQRSPAPLVPAASDAQVHDGVAVSHRGEEEEEKAEARCCNG